jgi:hypothetical protein
MTRSSEEVAALDALVADSRAIHLACIRLLERRGDAFVEVANKIKHSHSKYFRLAGTTSDPASLSHEVLLDRLGPIAEMMPPIVAATVPRSSLWAATGNVGSRWLVAMPAGVVSFYRRFCWVVFHARDAYQESPSLAGSIEQMSRLVGEQLEFGLLDLSGIDPLAQKTKPIIEHLTQLAYEFFLLHEACHIRERHEEPVARATTWYQEAHMRQANEFEADKWAFNTLLSSFSNDLHLVSVAIAMLFDSLDLLDRFEFAPMVRLTHTSPATRKWRLMRLLEAPEALEFLDAAKLEDARKFSMLYERLAAFLVDRAKPATPLNIALNRGAEEGPNAFIDALLPILATGDPSRIVRNLASVRSSSRDWANEGTEDDAQWASKVDACIDALAEKFETVPRLHGLAVNLRQAAARDA